MSLAYKRILIKLSGEALAGNEKMGIDEKVVLDICTELKALTDLGAEICVVVGGGNFWRGRSSEKMDRARADHMGMLATAINALALADTLEQIGACVRVQTAVQMDAIAESYIIAKARKHLEKGRILIFACGTGSPYFSTDTAAALRAAELQADIIFKATMVDGVYDKDPKKYGDAVKFDSLSMNDVLAKELAVMDSTAASMCRDNKIPVLVFDIGQPHNLVLAAKGNKIGTIINI